MQHNNYIFISSLSSELINKANELFEGKMNFIVSLSTNRINKLYSVNKYDPKTGLICQSGMNNFDSSPVPDPEKEYQITQADISHELPTWTVLKNEKLLVTSDILGLFAGFYFENEETFILSNNVFLISQLLNASFSKEAVLSSILFKKPTGNKTWFKDIFCLLPGEAANFDLNSGILKKYIYYSPLNLSDPSRLTSG